MAALLAMAACKSETGTNVGGAGGVGGSVGGSGGIGGSVGGSGGIGGTGGTASCYDCACADDSPCKLLCDDMTPGNLNFCTNGMTNGTMCGACVQTQCGSALADCN
ncbi:MAG: hypothetical protein QM820_16685 [Minicystis sp.]